MDNLNQLQTMSKQEQLTAFKAAKQSIDKAIAEIDNLITIIEKSTEV